MAYESNDLPSLESHGYDVPGTQPPKHGTAGGQAVCPRAWRISGCHEMVFVLHTKHVLFGKTHSS